MARIDVEALDMFTATLRSVLGADGDVTDALVEAGWRDVLVEDDQAIVPVQFRLQGALLARSAALDDVVRLATGVDGPVVHPRPGRGTAIAPDGTVDGLAFAPVDGLDAAVVRGLDPDLGLVRVTGRALEGLVDGGRATCAARRALAAELLGVAATMLDTATEHAKSRMQYGQPIGVFQAVKFRLADVLVAIQAAEVVLEEAWGDEADVAATAGKCLAGRAFRLAAENCLQVLGAIGFTWEHDLHRFIRRGLVLDVLYGSTEELRRELGATLIRRESTPRLGAL
ncbi:MAG: acyl-CoA dehydrogenase [Acidimicrobiia bacterium]